MSVGDMRGENVEANEEETGGRVNEDRTDTDGEETGGRMNVETRGENVETGGEETAGPAGEEMRGDNVETGGEETAGPAGEEMRGENVEMGGDEIGDRVDVQERGVNDSQVSEINSRVSENRENPDGNSVENVESQQREGGARKMTMRRTVLISANSVPIHFTYMMHTSYMWKADMQDGRIQMQIDIGRKG